jgi:hypothetical protein
VLMCSCRREAAWRTVGADSHRCFGMNRRQQCAKAAGVRIVAESEGCFGGELGLAGRAARGEKAAQGAGAQLRDGQRVLPGYRLRMVLMPDQSIATKTIAQTTKPTQNQC